MDAVIGGDRAAFAELYRRHAPGVWALARRRCGPGQAEDVVQEVFLRLWRKPERFDHSRGPLLRFLLMDTRGQIIDTFRSEASRRARETAEHHGGRDALEVEAEALGRLSRTEVAGLMQQLPERERRAIALAYFSGHTYREVAELLGQPEGTVKSQIRSGLARLRAALLAGAEGRHSTS